MKLESQTTLGETPLDSFPRQSSTPNSQPRPAGMKVMGIDPGSRFVGFGILQAQSAGWKAVDYGLIRLPVKESLSLRLAQLGERLHEVFLRHEIGLAVIEKVFLGKSVESAFTLGHARGVILAAAAKNQCEIKEYAARSVKKNVAGHGGADKVQVQRMLQASLGVTDFERDDVSDALALALYGARQWELARKISSHRGVEL